MKFSQNDEERVILEYFGDHVGTFCSVGENDGVTFSNVRALALRNWSGVMIEPDPIAFGRLQELYINYKKLYTYNYAIGDHNGKATLQKSGSLLNNGDTGLVSTFIPSEMDRFKSIVKYEPVEVKMYRWKTALNRWSIQKFDMVSLDCEGSELDILPHMELEATKLMVIEWNGNQALKAEYEKYLDRFKLIYTSGENLIYVR